MSETPGQVLRRIIHAEPGIVAVETDGYATGVFEAIAAAFLAAVGARCVVCDEVVARGEDVLCDRCGYLLAQERGPS